MGSIRRAPRSGRWEARFRDTAGRQRTATFDRKSDATIFLAAAETDVARGSWRDPALGRTPFADIARDWLASNPRKRPTTYAHDAMVIRVHLNPPLGELPIARVTPADVKAVVAAMEHRGLAPATVRTSYGVLRAILSWAVENDVIDRSPCRGVRLPSRPSHRSRSSRRRRCGAWPMPSPSTTGWRCSWERLASVRLRSSACGSVLSTSSAAR